MRQGLRWGLSGVLLRGLAASVGLVQALEEALASVCLPCPAALGVLSSAEIYQA